MGDKLYSVQILRGLAASLVVFLHILASLDDYYGLAILQNNKILVAFLESGVDIFFIISGFIMYGVAKNKFSKNSAFTFLKKRAFRVLPLYWFLTLFYASLLWVLPFVFHTSSFDINKIIKSLLFIPHLNNSGDAMPVLSVGWTLNFEMYFYVCFAIALMFNKRVGLLFTSSIFIFGCLLGYIFELPIFLSVLSNTLLFEFLMGVGISVVYFAFKNNMNKKQVTERVHSATRIIILCMCICLVSYYWFFIYASIDHFSRVLMWGIPSAVTLIIFLMLDQYITQWKALIFVGDISYSLYLIQVFTIPFMVKLSMLLEQDSLLFLCALGVSQYAISLIVASASYKYIELSSNHYLHSKFSS